MAEKIRRRVQVFAEGKLQIVDLNEKGNIIKRYSDQGREIRGAEKVKVAEKKQDDGASDKPVTKKQLMAALKEKGITFKATSSNKVLQELLDGAGQEDQDDQEEPDNPGTGNQDVI